MEKSSQCILKELTECFQKEFRMYSKSIPRSLFKKDSQQVFKKYAQQAFQPNSRKVTHNSHLSGVCLFVELHCGMPRLHSTLHCRYQSTIASCVMIVQAMRRKCDHGHGKCMLVLWAWLDTMVTSCASAIF